TVAGVGWAIAGSAAVAGLDDLVKVDCVDCADGGGGSSRDAGVSQKDASAPIDAGPTHAIGGKVRGLVGSGLVLENNGADQLVIAADGPFEFGARVAERAPYAVSIAMTPGGQACTVANGSGTVGTTD